jgi:hypothetical protein
MSNLSRLSQADQRYLADRNPPVCSLQIKNSFNNLTKEESELPYTPCAIVTFAQTYGDVLHAH